MDKFRSFVSRLRGIHSNSAKKFGDATLLSLAVAVIPRVIFVLHAVFSVRLLEKYMKYERIQTGTTDSILQDAWQPTVLPIEPIYTGLILLLFESLYTVVARRGHEYKHIWFSGFFYLVTQIPVICCLEYAFFQKRTNYANLSTRILNSTGTTLAVTKAPYVPDSYMNCFHRDLEFNCTEKFIKNFTELGLISVIIIGRWMLPRGELTRDQLSALLIGYVNTAADLTEFIGLHSKQELAKEKIATEVVLTIYSVSLLQFVVVTTSTTYEYSELEKDAIQSLNLSQSRLQRYMHPLNAKLGRSKMLKNVDHLTKEAFRSGKRAERRRHGINSMSEMSSKPIVHQVRAANASKNVVNETIYEESEIMEEVNDTSNIQDKVAAIFDGGSQSEITPKESPMKRSESLRSASLQKWQASLPVTVRLESAKKALNEENWVELSKTFEDMKMSKRREIAKQNEIATQEILKEVMSKEEIAYVEESEEDDDEDDRSSWHKWLEVVQTELGGLLIALFLQEIPFFFTRVAFIYEYHVIDRGVLFYTTKNFFMLCFLNYRLWVATTEE